MTGTTDLSIQQLEAIHHEGGAVASLGTGTIEKVVITPVGTQRAVKVTYTIVGYGTRWIIVERDGTVSDRELDDVNVAELLREAISDYYKTLTADDDPHNNRLAAALDNVEIHDDGTWVS